MPVVTLTTEWRPDDIYNGVIKGMLCSMCPGVIIVDNAGGIPAFNIAHASFVIRNTFGNYPEGSVHIICVHSEAQAVQNRIVVKAKGHYFIGSDNGIFNLILNSEPEEVVRIDISDSSDELEAFARAAACILSGMQLSEIGQPAGGYSERVPLRATIEKDVITGSVLFIDSYGNAISNITREVFLRVFENRKFRIYVQNIKHFTDMVSIKYSDVPVGDMLARFNRSDLLEVSINGANLSELLSISVGSVIRIDGTEKPLSRNGLF